MTDNLEFTQSDKIKIFVDEIFSFSPDNEEHKQIADERYRSGNSIAIGYIAIPPKPPKVSFKDIFETSTKEEFKEKLASYIESSFDN